MAAPGAGAVVVMTAKNAKPATGPGTGRPSDTSLKRKPGLFNKDLRLMLYGFGDDPNPIPDTVMLMEDILLDYIADMIHKAQEVAVGRGKLTTKDIMFLLSKDSRKFSRLKELLAMNKELKRARKEYEVDEEKFAIED